MDFGNRPHSLQEPVTDFTLHDAAAWCNALSEMESREPIYYEDPEFQKPLHEVRWSPAFVKLRELPKLYVKWTADGYRLPTVGEWRQALAGQKMSPAVAVIRENSQGQTQHVASKAPNPSGAFDLLGNVWEPVWTFGDCYDPAAAPAITVLGGDFLSPSDPAKRSASPWGDFPYGGSYNIGLRIVRRESGGATPAQDAIPQGVPSWTIEKDTQAKAANPRDLPTIELALVGVPGTRIEMARHETTFALWKQVRDWGMVHGYKTDYDGDMGSMDYWGFDPARGAAEPPPTHDGQEPVTDVTAYDMAVWCNALSEMTARKPVYYADQECQKAYKTAVRFRPIQFHFPADYVARYGEPAEADTPSVAMGAGASHSLPGVYAEDAMQRVLPPLYVDEQADGFRLPTLRSTSRRLFRTTRSIPGVTIRRGPSHSPGSSTRPAEQLIPWARSSRPPWGCMTFLATSAS